MFSEEKIKIAFRGASCGASKSRIIEAEQVKSYKKKSKKFSRSFFDGF